MSVFSGYYRITARCEGYIFTGVCLSTGGGVVSHSGPGGVCHTTTSGQTLLADTPPWADIPSRVDTPPCPVHAGIQPPCSVHAGIQSTSGLYASHWKAFLLIRIILD